MFDSFYFLRLVNIFIAIVYVSVRIVINFEINPSFPIKMYS